MRTIVLKLTNDSPVNAAINKMYNTKMGETSCSIAEDCILAVNDQIAECTLMPQLYENPEFFVRVARDAGVVFKDDDSVIQKILKCAINVDDIKSTMENAPRTGPNLMPGFFPAITSTKYTAFKYDTYNAYDLIINAVRVLKFVDEETIKAFLGEINTNVE